jgi:hypothetical protein
VLDIRGVAAAPFLQYLVPSLVIVVVLARDDAFWSSFDVFVVSRNARQLFTSKVFFLPC